MKLKCIALLFSLALSAAAQATVHSYQFTASLSVLADFTDLKNLTAVAGVAPGSVVTLGDKITGSFSYDTATPEYKWLMPNPDGSQSMFIYKAPGYKNEISVTMGPSGDTFAMSSASVHVGLYDRYEFSVWGPLTSAWVQLDLSTLSPEYSDGRMPEHLSLSVFDRANTTANWINPTNGHSIYTFAKFDSLTEVAAVPEPETYAMLLAGLGLIGTMSSRRRRTTV